MYPRVYQANDQTYSIEYAPLDIVTYKYPIGVKDKLAFAHAVVDELRRQLRK